MKRILSTMLPILAIAGLLASCSPAKWCAKHGQAPVASIDTFYRDSIVTRDSLVRIVNPADSSSLLALIECREGQAHLVELLNYKPGSHVSASATITHNILKVGCRVDSFAVYTTYREKEVFKQIRTGKVVVKITNVLTGWQWFQIWVGRIAILVLLIFVAWKLAARWFKSWVPELFTKLTR